MDSLKAILQRWRPKASPSEASTPEQQALDRVAARATAQVLGEGHKLRCSTLGSRLKTWYTLAILFFLLTFTAFVSHPYIFALMAGNMRDTISSLGIKNAMSIEQALILYYVSKISVVSLFLLPFLWILRRITRLQALRSIHADKEVQAKLLEQLLIGGHSIETLTSFHSAIAEVFSPSFEQTKNKKYSESNIRYEQIIKLLLSTLTRSHEEI